MNKHFQKDEFFFSEKNRLSNLRILHNNLNVKNETEVVLSLKKKKKENLKKKVTTTKCV